LVYDAQDLGVRVLRRHVEAELHRGLPLQGLQGEPPDPVQDITHILHRQSPQGLFHSRPILLVPSESLRCPVIKGATHVAHQEVRNREMETGDPPLSKSEIPARDVGQQEFGAFLHCPAQLRHVRFPPCTFLQGNHGAVHVTGQEGLPHAPGGAHLPFLATLIVRHK
jgi:hypothetical protein